MIRPAPPAAAAGGRRRRPLRPEETLPAGRVGAFPSRGRTPVPSRRAGLPGYGRWSGPL